MDQQIITSEGYKKLKKELEYLKDVKRPEISQRITTAKDMGDLSENAEYSEAKDAQAFNDGRIIEITTLLKTLTIVENGVTTDKVGMGSKITAETEGKKREFTIVSFYEADPAEGKISNESPLGRAFLDRKKGDFVLVNTPKGEVKYHIIDIN